MELEVLLFAHLKEQLGPRVRVEVPEGATARQVLEQLAHDHPEQGPGFLRARLAADDEFLSGEGPVSAESELAVIPPVSGG